MKVQVSHKWIPVFELCINTRLGCVDFTSVSFSRSPGIRKFGMCYVVKTSGPVFLSGCLSFGLIKLFPLGN